MSDNWLWMTASDLGRAIGKGEVEPRELAEMYLAAIDSHPEGPGIYARTTPDRALAEAEAATIRARAGLRYGPLDGVPVSWKDLFDAADVATEAGSALLKDRRPEADAAVLARATRAGLVCLGKTHMTELAFSGLGLNPMTATPPNINDPELAPGGSSSGAAASVAFGLAAAGIGSDTGGSIRLPSAWNDLTGFKPTHGRLSLAGVVPLCARFDTVGPLCRSVGDAALLFSVLDDSPAVDLTGAGLAGARLLVLDGGSATARDAAVTEGFEAAIGRLGRHGARIDRGSLPVVEDALALAPCIFASEAYGTWGEAIEAQPDLVFAPVRERFRAGATFSAPDYVRAWGRLDGLRAGFAEAVAGYDAVLLPSSPILPPNVEALLADHSLFGSENLLALRHTRIGNLMGLCALSLPTGAPSVGLMAMALPGEDRRLLRLGRAIETALDAGN